MLRRTIARTLLTGATGTMLAGIAGAFRAARAHCYFAGVTTTRPAAKPVRRKRCRCCLKRRCGPVEHGELLARGFRSITCWSIADRRRSWKWSRDTGRQLDGDHPGHGRGPAEHRGCWRSSNARWRLVFTDIHGVEVCAAMQHGGPYPATPTRVSRPWHGGIYRFTRPFAIRISRRNSSSRAAR